MIEYSLDDNGIFYVIFSGVIKFEDIKKFLHEFDKLTHLPDDLLTFYNLKNATLKLSWIDIIMLAKLAKKLTASFKTVRTVFLVSEPTNTAYSMLFIQSPSNKRTVRKVFSTEDAALDWLLFNKLKK